MTARPLQIAQDVRDVLARSTIHDTLLKLPNEKIPKPLFRRVDVALEALGGKWDRGKQGYAFAADPAAALSAATLSCRIAREDDNPFSFFWTGDDLAERVAEEAQVGPDHRVLEPNAGAGALVHPIVRRRGILGGTERFLLVELDERHRPALRARGYDSNVVWGDFLQLRQEVLGTFDRVVMNPPFEKEADAQHISHALDLLRPGGRLVAIASSGFLDRSTRKITKAARERVLAWKGRIERLPEDAFKHAGAVVRTVLVVVDRPGERAWAPPSTATLQDRGAWP